MAIIDFPKKLIFILLQLITIVFAEQLYQQCLLQIGNYSANSTYQANLNGVLSSLISENTEFNYGFYNFSAGEGPDRSTAVALCRGDVKPDDCRSCLNDSIHKLSESCPFQKEAIAWYDSCMLRYSNRSIIGIAEDQPAFYMWNVNNATDPKEFNRVLGDLLGSLRSRAASGGSLQKFATGDTVYTVFQRIYALVQCTPDLTELDCNDCLVQAFADIPICCDNKLGGRVIGPSCNFRYEVYRFYEPAAPDVPSPSPTPALVPPPVSSPQPNDTPTTRGKKTLSQTVIIIVVSTIVTVVLISSACIILRVRKRRERVQTSHEDVDEIKTVNSLQYNFDTIRVGTNNFCDANKLGQGGFGVVYKGKLPNGQDIAVERLSKNSGQGDLEFKNEVLLVAKLQHRNLVRLLGFCLEGKERLLVYEFLPNASLDHFIFDRMKRASLDWERRFKIIEGIARGILYLHEDSRFRIIHRDLKASNILLDAEMNAKISDFGMARLFSLDQSQAETSRIVGTYGYMAPEYAMHGNFSVKSDVFSFGVLVLEIVSGHKNSSFHNGENIEDLLSYAWKSWKEGTAQNLVDPTVRSGSRTEMMRCIHIGLLCVQENLADRPTMASVVLMLNSCSVTLPVPSQPAFLCTATGSQTSHQQRCMEVSPIKPI